ncbi:MAG: WD40 repeat domain-containing protein [Verrucomicrobiota bacterium]
MRKQNYVADIGLAHTAVEEGDLGRARSLLAQHLPSPGESDLRGFEWRWLASRCQGQALADLGTYHGFLGGLAISPGGQFVALNRENPARVEVMHLASKTVAKSIPMDAAVVPLKFSPSGHWLVGEQRGTVLAWDTRTWQQHGPFPLTFPLAFGHRSDPECFAACKPDHLEWWSTETWSKLADLTNRTAPARILEPALWTTEHMQNALAVSADDRIVSLANATQVRRWQLPLGAELAGWPIEGLSCLATSPDGQFAASDYSGAIHLLDSATGRIVQSFRSHLGWGTGLRFSHDGARLVSASADRKLVLIDPRRQTVLRTLLGHETEIWALDMSDDALAAADHQVRVFEVRAEPQELVLQDRYLSGESFAVTLSPDGRWLAASGQDNAIRIWDLLTGKRAATLRGHIQGVFSLCFSPDGQTLVSSSHNRLVFWNVSTWQLLLSLNEQVEMVQFARDGTYLAGFKPPSRTRAGRLRIWPTQPLAELDHSITAPRR